MSATQGAQRPKIPVSVLPMGRIAQLPESEEELTVSFNGTQAAELKARRDRKLARLLSDRERAWVVDEVVDTQAQVCTFAVLRRHLDRPGAPWYRQRYKYDGQTDVLYHWGERPATGDEVKAARSTPPFRPPS